MTIAADLTKKIYAGNDVTTVFPYPFKIFQSTDLVVILTDTTTVPDTETTLTAGVDYTVSGVGDESGGNVTYPVSGDPLATGEKITVWRVPAILQGTDFQNQGGFFAQTHEDSLDLLTMVCQYISEFVQRAFALSVSDQSGASLIVPGPEASKILGWNSAADALINLDVGSVSLALPASDSIIADMINAAGTQATLTKLLSGNTAIWQKGADVASAAVLPLLSDGNYADVTGTDAITSINSVGIGTVMILQFDGILTFTHHATDLVLPGGANITTAAGDHAIIVEYDAGKWVCVDFIRASERPSYRDIAETINSIKTFSSAPVLQGSAWPSFSVYLTANQTNITGADKIEWNGEFFDTNNDFDSSRFSPTVTGKYLLSVTVHWSSVVAGDDIRIYIENGNTGSFWESRIFSDDVTGSQTVTIVVDAIGSSDYFEVKASNNDRDTSTIDASTNFTYWTGCRIG